METLTARIRNPVALWREITELRRVHWGVSEITRFEDQYPEVYDLFRILEEHSEEVQSKVKTQKIK